MTLPSRRATVLAAALALVCGCSGYRIVRDGTHPYYVERRGPKVLAIEGALEVDLADLADRIWRRSTFEPNVPFVPIDVADAR